MGEPFPGLLGTDVNITTGLFIDGDGGWVGGDDSFYEYLIKMYLYDPVRFGEYKQRWILAVESSIKYLASHPTTRPDLTFLAIYNNQTLQFISEHCKFVTPLHSACGCTLTATQPYPFSAETPHENDHVAGPTLTGLEKQWPALMAATSSSAA